MPERNFSLWIFSALALAFFLLLMAAVWLGGQPYFGWDLAVSRWVQSLDWPGIERLMRGVSLAGDDALWSTVLVGAIGLVLMAFKSRREALALFGIVLAGQVLKIGIKLLVARPRPAADLVTVMIDAQEAHSFPSGHTVHYVVFFGFLWFLTRLHVNSPVLRWPLLGVFGGLVLLVGLARIYLGAHWASDIVGGYLLGAAMLAAGIALYRRWSSQPV